MSKHRDHGVGVNYSIAKRAAVNLSNAARIGPDKLLGQPQHKAMVWASTVIRF